VQLPHIVQLFEVVAMKLGIFFMMEYVCEGPEKVTREGK
jgi:hypothetical protein